MHIVQSGLSIPSKQCRHLAIYLLYYPRKEVINYLERARLVGVRLQPGQQRDYHH